MSNKSLEQLLIELQQAKAHHTRLKALKENRDVTRFWANKVYRIKKAMHKQIKKP